MNKKTAYIIPGNRVTTFLFFLAIFSVSLTAQDADKPEEDATIDIEYHSMGDQIFSINAGLFFPLFFQNPSPGSGEDAISSTNLSMGGTGHLYYGAYLNNNVILGMEIGAMFARSPNKNNFYMVPIMFRGTYEFQLKNNLFTIPVHLGAGMSMTSYLDDFHVDMIFKPGAGFFWNQSSDWSFGTNLTYWWVPQIYPSDPDYNRLGNFMDMSLSAVYHF